MYKTIYLLFDSLDNYNEYCDCTYINFQNIDDADMFIQYINSKVNILSKKIFGIASLCNYKDKKPIFYNIKDGIDYYNEIITNYIKRYNIGREEFIQKYKIESKDINEYNTIMISDSNLLLRNIKNLIDKIKDNDMLFDIINYISMKTDFDYINV